MSISYDNLEKTFCCVSVFGGKIKGKKKILIENRNERQECKLGNCWNIKKKRYKREPWAVAGRWPEEAQSLSPNNFLRFFS